MRDTEMAWFCCAKFETFRFDVAWRLFPPPSPSWTDRWRHGPQMNFQSIWHRRHTGPRHAKLCTRVLELSYTPICRVLFSCIGSTAMFVAIALTGGMQNCPTRHATINTALHGATSPIAAPVLLLLLLLQLRRSISPLMLMRASISCGAVSIAIDGSAPNQTVRGITGQVPDSNLNTARV